MANAYITATVQGVTSTAYHMWMGSVTGTPTPVDKTSTNTYTINISFNGSSTSQIESLILTNGIIESCSIISGAYDVLSGGLDSCSIFHGTSCSVSVKLSSDATWISIRPGDPVIDGVWPDVVYCNGINFGVNFIRWNIQDAASNYRTIRCYIDNEWKDCIVKYYDGQNWIDSIAKYFDGTQWVECSF